MPETEPNDLDPIPLTSEIIGGREKFLLYGAPKRGKTFTALTAPGPIYFLAIGGPNEAKTYFSKQFQEKHGKKDIIIQSALENVDKHGRCKTPAGFDHACNLLDRALELDDKGALPTETGGFETIVIDNATVLQEFQMNKTIYISNLTRSNSATGASTIDKVKQHGVLKPSDSDWGGAQSLMQNWYSWLFKLDKNIVFIAHEYEVTKADRATQTINLIGVQPLFVGKQRIRIANAFDNVWHFTYDHANYQARTVPQEVPTDIIAGTRVGGVIDKEWINPDLSVAIDKFKKHAESIERGEK
ncbi:MAG: AAA family ATPase [Nitrososphaerales archaeon]